MDTHVRNADQNDRAFVKEVNGRRIAWLSMDGGLLSTVALSDVCEQPRLALEESSYDGDIDAFVESYVALFTHQFDAEVSDAWVALWPDAIGLVLVAEGDA